MKSRTKIYILALIIIQLTILVIFGSMKKGMHFDECFSYFNTNNSVGRQAFDRSFVTSEDILKDFYVKNGEGFNYDYVIELQSYDVHPPFFYILLHTLCSFMPGVFSIWQGVALNILYSLITSIFIFYIFRILTKENDLAAFVIALLTAINTGVISNAMYIRMYCLMTMLIVMAVYLHVRMLSYKTINELPVKFIVLNMLLAFLGFMTHYFYLLFIFFLEAAYIVPLLFKFKANIKGIIKYSFGMLIAGILGVILYPSCLGHVNSGYRGNEVKSYLVNLSDFKQRFSFFGGLMDKYAFNSFFSIFLLIFIMLFLMAYYKKRVLKVTKGNVDKSATESGNEYIPDRSYISCYIRSIVIPTLGYFIISVKASLMGDEAMMRYQLPIYGLVFSAFLYAFYLLFLYVSSNIKKANILCIIFSVLVLCLGIKGLLTKNVFYLYEEVENMEAIASEYADRECVYIYNGESNKYRLWNDALQLAKFDEVYFINSENTEPISEASINDANSLVVYVSMLGQKDNFDDYVDFIFENNSNLTSYKKLYDAMCAQVYIFE